MAIVATRNDWIDSLSPGIVFALAVFASCRQLSGHWHAASGVPITHPSFICIFCPLFCLVVVVDHDVVVVVAFFFLSFVVLTDTRSISLLSIHTHTQMHLYRPHNDVLLPVPMPELPLEDAHPATETTFCSSTRTTVRDCR